MTTSFKLRPPTSSNHEATNFTPSTLEWLLGTWHVTHSTLPMWKSKQNVKITYKSLEPAADGTLRLDDLVEYQALNSEKIRTIEGVDTASRQSVGAWDWRGKGWLKIASSHWQVLGYGDLDEGGKWAVTYFAKTLFTPAGIDIYSRTKDGLRPDVVEGIKGAFSNMKHDELEQMATTLFEVKHT